MLLVRLSLLLTCSTLLIAQVDSIVDEARQYQKAHEREIVTSYMELLAIPNVAADPANLRRNAEMIVQALQKRGVTTNLLERPGVPPVVYGELLQPGPTMTRVPPPSV
jgi:hypothetical protein